MIKFSFMCYRCRWDDFKSLSCYMLSLVKGKKITILAGSAKKNIKAITSCNFTKERKRFISLGTLYAVVELKKGENLN